MSDNKIRVHSADLAAMPGGPHPIPSRTRSLSPPGPMVLRLKARESRSLPGLPNALSILFKTPSFPDDVRSDLPIPLVAGWSSPVARQAHNLKVVGSNPAPAPKFFPTSLAHAGLFCVLGCLFGWETFAANTHSVETTAPKAPAKAPISANTLIKGLNQAALIPSPNPSNNAAEMLGAVLGSSSPRRSDLFMPAPFQKIPRVWNIEPTLVVKLLTRI
jgi:hypothetical protein